MIRVHLSRLEDLHEFLSVLTLGCFVALSSCAFPVFVGSNASTDAGRIVGPCVVGDDLTCNLDTSNTAVSGRCVVNGNETECVCAESFVRDSATGKCAAAVGAVCTVGIDTTCTDLLPDGGVSAGVGRCVRYELTPECECLSGSQLNPATRRCRPPLAGDPPRPNLPVIGDISCGPSFGPSVTVSAGQDLQAAIDAASLGDTLLLEPGATFVGPIVLKAKQGTGCLTIRTAAPDSALPSFSGRISPAYANVLPKIVSPGRDRPAIITEDSAHHYRLLGLEVTKSSETDSVSRLIVLGDRPMTPIEQIPHHIELDRLYVHGLPNSSLKFCILLNNASTTVKNSYISECKELEAASIAVGGWLGPGPFRIVNNYLESAGANVLFGGASPLIQGLVPSDIELRGNTLSKPLRWKIDDPTYQGTPWQVEVLLQLMLARRVLIDGNTFEHCWVQKYFGFALNFTVRNSNDLAPWSVTEDLTVTNNLIRRSANAFGLSGLDSNFVSQPTRRVLLSNNLFLDIGGAVWGGSGRLIQVVNGPADFVVEHNTSFQAGTVLYALGNVAGTNFVFRDNIAPHNTYGVYGESAGVGLSTLNKYFPGFRFARNVLIANPSPSSYPPDNLVAADASSVGFADAGAMNYRLGAGSPYRGRATDGSDIGINWPQ